MYAEDWGDFGGGEVVGGEDSTEAKRGSCHFPRHFLGCVFVHLLVRKIVVW